MTVTRRSFPLLYSGSELVVAGRVADGVSSLEAEVEVWGAAPGSSAAMGAAPGRRLLRAQADVTGLTPPPPPGKKKGDSKVCCWAGRGPSLPSSWMDGTFMFASFRQPPIGILERLWAYLSVKQLLDVDLMKHEDDIVDVAPKLEPGLDQPRKRALWLALKVSMSTALIATLPLEGLEAL